jgi:hypothetical protein
MTKSKNPTGSIDEKVRTLLETLRHMRDIRGGIGEWRRVGCPCAHRELCRKLGDDGLRKAAYRGWRPNRPESPKENDTP